MTTLQFIFNKEKVAAAGTTEDALLAPMREHAAKYGIEETAYGFFSKDGEDAMCVLSMIIPRLVKKDIRYLDLLEKWTLDVDGEEENCIQSSREWLIEHQTF